MVLGKIVTKKRVPFDKCCTCTCNCLAYEAEVGHMYCFTGGGVVVGSIGINFYLVFSCLGHFLKNYKG